MSRKDRVDEGDGVKGEGLKGNSKGEGERGKRVGEEINLELILMLSALDSVSALFESGRGSFIEKRFCFFVKLIDISILFHGVIVIIIITVDGALLTITKRQFINEERLLVQCLVHRCHLLLHHGHERKDIRPRGSRSRGDR